MEESSIILTPAMTSGSERVAQRARLQLSNPDTPWTWTFQFWHPYPHPLLPAGFQGWGMANPTTDPSPSNAEMEIAFCGANPIPCGETCPRHQGSRVSVVSSTQSNVTGKLLGML